MEHPDLLPLPPPADPPKPIHFTERPLLRTLQYVVQEARKHADAGNDDHFVQVGRVAQAALLWNKADDAGNLDDAERWLERLPRKKD